MRAGKIYLMEPDGLVPMVETEYSAEELLQELLAKYPDLLAGDQMQPSQPRRWLLITREAGIPGTEGGTDRFWLDHLFVDQDGVPTLVEVKRSSDTRLRREVIGQMLDYAANVAAYWAPAEIRSLFEEHARPNGTDPDEELAAFLQPDSPVDVTGDAADSFWQRVSDNLASRRLRLVFVADVIPSELQRIVEFLNESMARTEVLAVEVKQFVGAGRQTLVPRVIGQTAAAENLKRPGAKTPRVVRDWTEAEFLAAASEAGGSDWHAFLRQAIAWARQKNLPISFGRGKHGPMYIEATTPDGAKVAPLAWNTVGGIEVGFVRMAGSAPFDTVEARVEWCRMLNAVSGVSIAEDRAVRASWPSIRFDNLPNDAAKHQLLDALGWAIDRLESPGRATAPHQAGA